VVPLALRLLLHWDWLFGSVRRQSNIKLNITTRYRKWFR
jgi:hypothetical protein